MLDGLSKVEDVTAILQTYDSTIAQVAISQAKLAESDKTQILNNLEKIKTQNLIHKDNIQDIVDMAKLDAEKSLELKTRLNNAVAEEIEEKVLDTLTRTQLEEILNATEITVAKRQEILARYDNAAAAKKESGALDLYMAGLKKSLLAAKDAVVGFSRANPAGAILAVVTAGYFLYQKYVDAVRDKARDAKDSYDALVGEVEGLESELATVRQRIQDIESLGTPELVDDDELKKLKQQNDALTTELQLKKDLKAFEDMQAEEAALKSLGTHYYTTTTLGVAQQADWSTALDSYARDYRNAQTQIDNLKKQLTWLTPGSQDYTYKSGLVDMWEEVKETQVANINKVLDEIETDVVDIIGDTALTKEGQAFLQEWESQRSQLADILSNWVTTSIESIGNTVGDGTTDSDSAKGADLNTKLASVIEKYKLLEELQDAIKNGGKISADSLSGIVEQFSGLDQSVADYHQGLITADELVRRVATAYQAAVNGYSDLGGKLDIESLLADEKEVKTFSEHLEDIVGKYDLLHEAQEAFSESGRLTSSTLTSIVEKFPKMEESVALYVAGMKSGKELIAELTSAYRNDEATWEATMKAKLYASEDFRKGLSKGQAELIEALADSYGVDLENFKTVEEAKSKIQAQIVGQLAARYRRYADATLEELKAEYAYLEAQLYGGDDLAGSMNLADERRLQAIWDAIESLEKAYSGLDDIVFEGWDWSPRDFSDSIDDAEDAFEKFKAKWNDWFSDMEFKVNLKYEAGDLSSASELYQQMVDKAQELLNDAYAEGMTIDDDWVQDLITKVNTYKKALADLRIEEYDKLIEYNDQFDVWNHVSYTKLDKLKEKLAAINEQYIKGLVSYQEWYDAFVNTASSIYDIQRDAIDALLDTVLDAIKAQHEAQMDAIEEQRDAQIKALEEQRDAYNDLIEAKKLLLEESRDEANYEREVEKRVKSIADLQARIALLSLDNSREATAERLKLEEQLAQEQEELANYQNDYATDAAIDALDKQGEAFSDSIDGKIDVIEDAADAELAIIQQLLKNEVSLRQQAIAQIDRDYQSLLQNVREYFEALGITIDEELLEKLTTGLELVAQFGGYNSASSGISTSIGAGASNALSVSALVQQMKNNSQAWWNAKTPGTSNTQQNAEQLRLVDENRRIVQILKSMGLDIWEDDGQWLIRINGVTSPLFSVYHSGGTAGDIATPKSDEIFALLRKGEVILNDDQQSSLLNIFNNAGKWMQSRMSQTVGAMMSCALGRASSGDESRLGTFAPNIEVNISHSGSMSDADAKRYGNQIADVALDKLWSTLQKRGIT